jgi:putative endopeptidase
MKTLKKINNIRNKTHKNNDKLLKKTDYFTEQQKQIICKKYPNDYDTFEDKVEEIFKKNKIDILSASYNLEKEVIKELKKAVNPSKITPNNDFYSYINDRWLKDYDIEEHHKYIVQVDNFRLVQDKVYRELIEIIENYLKNPKFKNSKKSICMKNAYESFKIKNTIEQTKNLANIYAEYIDELIKCEDNIWKILAKSNMNEIISWGSPFVWSINPDDKNPKIYKCCIEPPLVTLLDVDIYFDDKTDNEDDIKYKEKYRNGYFKFLNKLFILVFGENHGYNVKDIYNCEHELLNAMSCDLIKGKAKDIYNIITKEEAINYFQFNWEEFCRELGFNIIPDSFITSNVNYLLCGTKLFKEKWNSKEWKTYWIYLYIRQQCRWDEKGAQLLYEFEGKFLRGQEQIIETQINPVFGMGYTFNTFLTNEYVYQYKNQQSIDYVTTMIEDLRVVFMRIIKRNDWMQPKTKEIALEKLKEIKLIVGSPDILREDPLLDYKPNDPWGNLIKMAMWRHKTAIELVNKNVIDIPVIDWSEFPPKFVSTQAYVVNAMYTPTENTIYIPLGYIQKPFVDLDERGIEYNLAHIGFTIAHEMSHALDDLGSKYDKNGALCDWWTEKDKKQFYKIQEDIVKQYEKYASYDGLNFDAWPSVGEDLADIAGFAICQEYLRDFQLKNQDILPIQSVSFEAFFIYFAIQSRQKISKRAVLAQLKTNPHPLDKYRCNIPLSRSRIFRTIYDVKKGDKMWWSSFSNVWTD